MVTGNSTNAWLDPRLKYIYTINDEIVVLSKLFSLQHSLMHWSVVLPFFHCQYKSSTDYSILWSLIHYQQQLNRKSGSIEFNKYYKKSYTTNNLNVSVTLKQIHRMRPLTLQASGGTRSWTISPPCTQNLWSLVPALMSHTQTEKSTPPETRWLGS